MFWSITLCEHNALNVPTHFWYIGFTRSTVDWLTSPLSKANWRERESERKREREREIYFFHFFTSLTYWSILCVLHFRICPAISNCWMTWKTLSVTHTSMHIHLRSRNLPIPLKFFAYALLIDTKIWPNAGT